MHSITGGRQIADNHLGVVVALVGGRVCTEKVIVALVVYVPHKTALSFVQDNRNRCIVMGSEFVFPLNELQHSFENFVTTRASAVA